jgi:hypothetical protein
MTRDHSRSPQGERAEVTVPFNSGNNVSVISSLSLTGVGSTMEIEGAVDTQVFDAFVEHFLAPILLENDIVLLDKVKFHYSARAIPSHSTENRCRVACSHSSLVIPYKYKS